MISSSLSHEEGARANGQAEARVTFTCSGFASPIVGEAKLLESFTQQITGVPIS